MRLLSRLFLLTIAGSANVLAFAPFSAWYLQPFCLAIFFCQLLRAENTRSAALLAYCFALPTFLIGIHWLYISMHQFGGLLPSLALLALLLFCSYLALYTVLFACMVQWLRRYYPKLTTSCLLLCCMPLLWVVQEYLRATVFTGFPWLSSGYAQIDSSLSAWAPVLGVYGISGLTAFVAAVLAWTYQNRANKHTYLLAASMLFFLLMSCYALQWVQWTKASGQEISVRLIQGGISQDRKFDENELLATLKFYHRTLTAQNADLIAVPETAIPLLPQQLPDDYLPSLQIFSRQTQSHILLGLPDLKNNQPVNRLWGISPQAASYAYDKHHLVPFGEFIPLGFAWFVNLMQIPLGDFARGSSTQAPMKIHDQSILPNICYEDIFGAEMAKMMRANLQTSILLNASNMAWFGETMAIDQHLQISRMRAKEMGRPMIRATNTGATAMIDASGNVVKVLPYTAAGVLFGKVQGYQGITPYLWWGDKAILLLSFTIFSALLIVCHRNSRNGL